MHNYGKKQLLNTHTHTIFCGILLIDKDVKVISRSMAVAQVQVELKDIWTGVEVGKTQGREMGNDRNITRYNSKKDNDGKC